MPNQFITPNWHPLLLHYPIALLILGVLIEIITFGWPRGGLRAAGRWMVLLGALLAVPTVTAGIYAFRSVVMPGGIDIDQHWHQVVQQSPWSARQWDFMANHVWFNSFAVVLFLAAAVFWLGGSDAWRRSARWPLLLVVLVGVGLMSAGAWFGGELVYRMGTGVVVASTPPAGEAARHDIRFYILPLQLHQVLAGFVGALVVAAFALTIRRWQLDAMDARLPDEGRPIALGANASGGMAGPSERAEMQSQWTYDAGTPAGLAPARVYPGWTWLGAVVVGLGTAAAGAWSALGYFTRDALQVNWEELQSPEYRRLAGHVILGVSIVVLSLILAGLVRFARRWRVLAGILAALVLLLLAGQIWLGVQLTYDGHAGPLTRFVAAETPAAPQPAPQSPSPAPGPQAAPAAPPAEPGGQGAPPAAAPGPQQETPAAPAPQSEPAAPPPAASPGQPEPGQGGAAHEQIGA